MARTEREKQDELLGMIRRDFTPNAQIAEPMRGILNSFAENILSQLPAPELVREEIEEDFDDGTKEAWELYLNRD